MNASILALVFLAVTACSRISFAANEFDISFTEFQEGYLYTNTVYGPPSDFSSYAENDHPYDFIFTYITNACLGLTNKPLVIYRREPGWSCGVGMSFVASTDSTIFVSLDLAVDGQSGLKIAFGSWVKTTFNGGEATFTVNNSFALPDFHNFTTSFPFAIESPIHVAYSVDNANYEVSLWVDGVERAKSVRFEDEATTVPHEIMLIKEVTINTGPDAGYWDRGPVAIDNIKVSVIDSPRFISTTISNENLFILSSASTSNVDYHLETASSLSGPWSMAERISPTGTIPVINILPLNDEIGFIRIHVED